LLLLCQPTCHPAWLTNQYQLQSGTVQAKQYWALYWCLSRQAQQQQQEEEEPDPSPRLLGSRGVPPAAVQQQQQDRGGAAVSLCLLLARLALLLRGCQQ
jgi:hypothetical protein